MVVRLKTISSLSTGNFDTMGLMGIVSTVLKLGVGGRCDRGL
jgi:hypothetical protein